jgi:uncharacterized membrane protein YjdF
MKKEFKILSTLNIFLIVLSLATLLFLAVNYYTEKDYFMMISCILVMILPFLIYLFEILFNRKISTKAKFLYLIFVYLSAVLGAVGNFYNDVFMYDKVVHFVSGILSSALFLTVVKYYDKKRTYTKKILFFSTLCFSSTIAVLWEICEFSFDFVFGKNAQKGNNDTMLDMIVAIVACIVFAAIYINEKDKKITDK